MQNLPHEKEFGDKLLYLQDNDVRITQSVMVPEHWEEYYERSKRFGDRGSPLHRCFWKPQSDPTASFVVGGYTEEQKNILQQDIPR